MVTKTKSSQGLAVNCNLPSVARVTATKQVLLLLLPLGCNPDDVDCSVFACVVILQLAPSTFGLVVLEPLQTLSWALRVLANGIRVAILTIYCVNSLANVLKVSFYLPTPCNVKTFVSFFGVV